MDYDENDFQSQNFQLVGEEKFPANLRPFTLPRFDLDEHLRFDSLVEEEVLLGMRGQENNWIDFPSGGLEFSSSAAEACSIARHNNVWSEATSSESVDLLLKSVGEDEMINKKAVIMNASATDHSHNFNNNKVDLYVEKNDSHESLMMDILPVNLEMAQNKFQENFSVSNECQRELLPNFQDSSVVAEVEESGISMHVDPSNKDFYSDGKIAEGPYTNGDSVTSIYNAIEKPKEEDKLLFEAAMNKKDVCEMLVKTVDIPSIEKSDLHVVEGQNLTLNHDAKVDMKTEKSNIGLVFAEQDKRNASNSSGFFCGDVCKEKSLSTCSEEKTSYQLESKLDALESPSTKCNTSVFPANSDGLVEAVSFETKSLNCSSEACQKIFTKEECLGALALKHAKTDHDSSALKTMTQVIEGPGNISDNLPYDSVEDDAMFGRTMFDNRKGKLETCMDADDHKQGSECQLVENKIVNIAHVIQPVTELPGCVDVALETPGTETIDCERMIPSSLNCEKSALVVNNNFNKNRDAVRSDVKLNEDEDVVPDDSSLHLNEFPLPVIVTNEEIMTPSTYCKSSMYKASESVPDLAETHITQVDASVDKDLLATHIPSKTNSDLSNVMDKVHNLPSAIQDTAVKLSLSSPANKLVEELGLEKVGSGQQSTPERSTNIALVIGTKELSKQMLSASKTLHSDRKDATIPRVLAPSISVTDAIVEKEDSKLSKNVIGVNLSKNKKEDLPSCLSSSNFFAFKDNEMKPSGGFMLSTSMNNVDKGTVSAAGNAVGIEKALLLEGNNVCHVSSREGNVDILNTLKSVSHSGNGISDVIAHTASGIQAADAPLSLNKECSYSNEQNDGYKLPQKSLSDELNVPDQIEDNLSNHGNASSPVLIARTSESGSSKTQCGNFSSERKCVSPLVIGCTGSHRDDSVLKTSGIMALSTIKNEITNFVDSNSNGLSCTSVEARSHVCEVLTSKGLPTLGVGSELSFLSLKTVNENVQGFPEVVKILDSSMKTPNKGIFQNASKPSKEKKTCSKGKNKKEAHALKQSSAMNAQFSSSAYRSVGCLSKDVLLSEMQEDSSNESDTIKTSSSLAVPTSSIPDLNSSSSVAFFHQPFTDLQQLQLRAQIYVYGSLISGMLPDEVSMMSAFGGADGGRNLWEGVWHDLILRFQNKRSPVGGYDTPSHSRSAIWIPDQVSMGNDVQSKLLSTSAKSDSIIATPVLLNPTAPLPSPLWSLPYGTDRHPTSLSRGTYLNFSHSPSPLTHQTPISRQLGANSPWLSQAPRPGPWFVSTQNSALDGATRCSTLPVTETISVTSLRDSCRPLTPTVQVVPPSVLMPVPDTSTLNTAADLQMEASKKAAASGHSNYSLTAQKARKKKKGTASDEPSLPVSQTLAQSVSPASVVRSIPLPSANILPSSNPQLNVTSTDVTNSAPVSKSSPHIISPTHYQVVGNNSQQKAILSEETCTKIEQAKLQAEDAAALAASTVKRSEAIWSQLASHRNSRLVSHIEEKLTSAAVAAAAAVSVAKAAAAAANVAACAALQAKLIADEAISASKAGNTFFNPESGVIDTGKKIAGISPVSILKGMDKLQESGAFIAAASEAARRRVESASASMKRAENLDAIVKAAELAAEAVAQAGTIITMGDPLPFSLSQLVDAGPEGFWRGNNNSFMKLTKSFNVNEQKHLDLSRINEHGESANELEDHVLKDNEFQKVADEGCLSSLNDCHEQLDQISQGNFPSVEQEIDLPISSIQKGSVVEVMSDEDGRQGAWFSAQVLDMDDNKAYVCYTDVSTTEGQLKEWILLENGEKTPRIRTAHYTALVKHEGTRKRRREHLGSYIWEVGDHVDAWIHDRWWEGIVTEKTPGDETKLTVHLPARSDKQTIHAWNLRPSRIWKDGQWMEWNHAKGKLLTPHEGDTPQEKRQRLGKIEEKTLSEVDAAGTDKLSKNFLTEESRKPDDSSSLVLSVKDKVFSIGNNSKEVISDALRRKRTGLQKDISRVVFGVPRPGKKRKFMEVSKHYVANKSEKISEGNDSIKFAKYLMPQTSRQPRNTVKVDNIGKKPIETKPRSGPKAENSQRFQTRSLSEKDKAVISTSNEETSRVSNKDVLSSFKGNNNGLDKTNAVKFSSFPNQAEKMDASVVESEDSLLPATTSLPKKKKTSGSETNLALKPKVSMDRTFNAEDKGPRNSGKADAIEPRRSNRRIQPTSRLLEGLQSSLVISKLPAASHDRKPFRGSSSRGNAHG